MFVHSGVLVNLSQANSQIDKTAHYSADCKTHGTIYTEHYTLKLNGFGSSTWPSPEYQNNTLILQRKKIKNKCAYKTSIKTFIARKSAAKYDKLILC